MANTRIEDAGLKLEGARKDQPHDHLVNLGRQEGLAQEQGELTLKALWPLPEKQAGHRNVWQTLASQIGPQRAARVMVLYGNLAPQPHSNGHFEIEAKIWRQAYRHAIHLLRVLLLEEEIVGRQELNRRFKDRMRDFVQETFPERITGDKVQILSDCAAGIRNWSFHNHPFNFTAINEMRFDTLARWGWGTDPRVPDKFAMGALQLINRATAESYWMSVRAVAGGWEDLDQQKFETEEQALENTAQYVQKLLQAPPKPKNNRPPVQWKREPLMQSLAELDDDNDEAQGEGGQDSEANERIDRESDKLVIRTGFATPPARGKTAQDLIEVFGFRGIEFGNYVSQTQRRWFVDGTFDACMDLANLMGVPPRFISLNGKLGIAYGSRGTGIMNAGLAHFEPDNQVIHLTRDQGPGALAHELGHAFDFWIPTALRRVLPEQLQRALPMASKGSFASELFPTRSAEGALQDIEVVRAIAAWNYQREVLPDWLEESVKMDRIERRKYWCTGREIFARGFEIMVHDAMLFRGRRNLMLVSGVSEKSGTDLHARGLSYPYPLAGERQKACQLMAAVVRGIKALQREYDRQDQPQPQEAPQSAVNSAMTEAGCA